MTVVFSEDKALTEFLLKILLSRDDLRVKIVLTQKEKRNLFGRSVRGKAVYEIAKTVKGTDLPFDDGCTIIYVNGAYRGKGTARAGTADGAEACRPRVGLPASSGSRAPKPVSDSQVLTGARPLHGERFMLYYGHVRQNRDGRPPLQQKKCIFFLKRA